jgi:hypothetical protein
VVLELGTDVTFVRYPLYWIVFELPLFELPILDCGPCISIPL